MSSRCGFGHSVSLFAVVRDSGEARWSSVNDNLTEIRPRLIRSISIVGSDRRTKPHLVFFRAPPRLIGFEAGAHLSRASIVSVPVKPVCTKRSRYRVRSYPVRTLSVAAKCIYLYQPQPLALTWSSFSLRQLFINTQILVSDVFPHPQHSAMESTSP